MILYNHGARPLNGTPADRQDALAAGPGRGRQALLRAEFSNQYKDALQLTAMMPPLAPRWRTS